MTDRYENIRKALAMGPTPGPWLVCPTNSGTFVKSERVSGYLAEVRHCRTTQDVKADAHLIAACDPDTIRALLAERDQLAAEIEALRAEVERLRADRGSREQQPAAVDEAMVFRLAVWMAKHDGCEDPHRLIYEGSPPVPWGEVWNRYEYDARAALTAALATQHQEPTA